MALLLAACALAGCRAGADPPAATRTRQYVALGDSLATGVQPNAHGHDRATTDGYVERVWRQRLDRHGRLVLVKLGRGGETATSMLRGRGRGPSQLELAERALRARPTSLVTIDIGANEIERCRQGTRFDHACLRAGFRSLRQSLPEVLRRLRAAAGRRVPIVAINYYNAFLGAWITGRAGRRLARRSVPVERRINRVLGRLYRRAQVPVADVETAFATDRLRTYVDDPRYGRIPLAVQRVCRWTWACAQNGDDHTNTAGYRVIADRVIAVLNRR